MASIRRAKKRWKIDAKRALGKLEYKRFKDEIISEFWINLDPQPEWIDLEEALALMEDHNCELYDLGKTFLQWFNN